MAFIKSILAQLEGADTQLMSTEDVHFFLSICKRRWMKPVNFIPILDQDFKIYYKKDSLWQSENVDCVHEEDPQRVCILQACWGMRRRVSTIWRYEAIALYGNSTSLSCDCQGLCLLD